jgi:hypothetical protein
MTAGLNITARVWRMLAPTDDDVGGALMSGTVAYECIHARFTEQRPSMLLVQQGIETEKMAQAMLRPPSLVLYETDHFEITGPPNHPFYLDRWRIMSIETPSMHPSDGRGFLTLTLSRIVRTRTEPNQ